MRGKMWMGTRGYERWVPACAISPDFSRTGFSNGGETLNGGYTIDRSKMKSNGYAMTWNNKSQDDMRFLTDLDEGMYDSHDGKNFIYFLDPMQMDKNLAPKMWSAFALAIEDGMPLIHGQRPRGVPTPPNQFGYPARSAVYRCVGASEKMYLPIPPGYVAWFGVHGAADGSAGIRMTPFKGADAGPYSDLKMLSVQTDELVNQGVSSTQGYTGFELALKDTGSLVNLSPNPSAEVSLEGWGTVAVGAAGGASALQRGVNGKVGASSVLQVYSSAPTAAGGGVTHDVPVVPGHVYSYAAYVRTSHATRVSTYLRFYNASGEPVGGIVNGAVVGTAASPGWSTTPRLANTNAVAPAGAKFARIAFGTTAGTGYNNLPAGGWMNVDAIQINEGNTVSAYGDGDMEGWEWTNGKGISPSRKKPDLITLSGLVIQILPVGVAPKRGPYISGQGSSGCQIESMTMSPYNKALNMVGVTMKLKETELWE